MLSQLLATVPPDALNIALVLALASFVGLEREEQKQHEPGYAFGGITTFPLIGLVSYSLALISTPQFVPWTIGFAVVGAFMVVSYRHKLTGDPTVGVAAELTALATYVVGGLVHREQYWAATTIAVLCVLLLELKKGLEGLTNYFTSTEIITVTKFLVLSVVILPIVPDRELTGFRLNPFKTWLVVVAVSGVSFASYVLQRVFKERGGVMLSAILGGAYSSTVTTVVLARQAKSDPRPNLFAGSILAASGLMYARLVLLLLFFNHALAVELAPAFGVLALAGVVAGWVISRRGETVVAGAGTSRETRNPLELRAAFLFALVFVVIIVLTNLATKYLGRTGLYSLAAIMGVTDVDPFILGLAQTGATVTPIPVAASAIVIAASANNVVKAIYAWSFADRATGRRSLLLLSVLAVLGLIPLVWL